MIESLILFIRAFGRLLNPKRSLIVDGSIFDGFSGLKLLTLLFSFFLTAFFTLGKDPVSLEIDKIEIGRDKGTILPERHSERTRIEYLLGFLGKLDTDDRSSCCLVGIRDLKFHTVFGVPLAGCFTVDIALSLDRNIVRYHECRIETETEMSDDAGLIRRFFLILGYKVHSAGKSDLVDVFIQLLFSHTDSVIFELYDLGIVIPDNTYLIVLV